MNRKIIIKFIIAELILFVLLIFTVLNLFGILYENNNRKMIKWNMIDSPGEVVCRTARPNSDWSELPLSKAFKKKYTPQKGILNDETIKEVVYDMTVDKDSQVIVLTVIDNRKQDEFYVHYLLNDKNELDDIEIIKHKLSYDENGKEIIYKRTMNEINYKGNLQGLADIGRLEYDIFEYISVTDNYKTKFAGGFVNSRGFEYYSISTIDELCSFNDKIVYLKCEYPKVDDEGNIIDLIDPTDHNLTLYYCIHFYVNEKNWLDDIDVNEVSKEEIDILLSKKKLMNN